MLPQFDRFRRTKLFRGDLGAYTLIQFPGDVRLDLTIGAVHLGLIFTDHAPLTRGSGVGELATIQDVTVVVDGVSRVIYDIDPLCGVIYVLGPIVAGSEVVVDYHWTNRLITPFTSLNDPNQTLNQWHNDYNGPFTYSTLSLPGLKPQPQLNGYRYRMLERAYSALLNDPTLMVFNEDSRQIYANRLEASFQASSTSFEGDVQPTDPNVGFTFQGTSLGVVDGLNRSYILTDNSSSKDITGSFPNFFRKSQPLNTSYLSIVNTRFRLDSWIAENDWTGFSWGWADSQHMIFVSALDIGGFTTLGLLTSTGDESNVRSYAARTRPVESRVVNGMPQIDLLIWDGPPPFSVGTRLLLDGLIRAADVVTIDPTDATRWLVQLSSPVPLAQDYTVFVEVDFSKDASYRIETREGRVEVYRASLASPIASVARESLAVTAEVYGALVRSNEIFWGCMSRRAETVLALDFLRYIFTPVNTSAASFSQSVRMEGDVLPTEDPTYPWALADNEGYASIVDTDYIQIQEAGKATQGGYGYVRYEPYLNSNTIYSGKFRLRVHSWALGSPAQMVVSDGVKELTIGLWEDPSSITADTSAALALLSKGLWQFPDAISLQSKGNLVGATNLLTSRFLHPFSGTTFPDVEGWTTTFAESEQDFVDDTWLLRHQNGIPASATRQASGSFNSYITSLRFRAGTYQTDSLNFFAIPFWFGCGDGESQVYVTLCDDGSQPYAAFCTATGQVISNGLGPLRRPFSWNDRDFHTIRVVRNGQFVSLYLDDIFSAVYEVSDFPPPPNVNLVSGFFVGSQNVELDVDYLFTHSQTVNPRRIGLYRGGDYNASSSYDLLPLEWYGTFAEIETFRDPQGQVYVYANGSTSPIFEVAYEQLPDVQSRPQIASNGVPYVMWGSFDPRSYSQVLWDYVRYDLKPRSERIGTLPNNINNWANVITSSEPLLDTSAHQFTLVSDTKYLVRISQLGRNPERVLSVTSLDGLISYPYVYQKGERNIVILGVGLPQDHSPVLVTFLEGKPWTENYLKSQIAVTRLNEGTPIVPLSLTGQMRAEIVPDDALTDPPIVGSGGRQYSDGKNTVRFVLNQPRPYYEALEIYQDSQGEPDLISSVCDAWVNISFDLPYAESYMLPSEGVWGSSSLFILGSSLLNGMSLLAPGSRSPVRFTLSWLNQDSLDPIVDEFQTGTSEMVDAVGASLLNNPLATLNLTTPVSDPVYLTSSVFTLNTPGIPTTYPVTLTGPIP